MEGPTAENFKLKLVHVMNICTLEFSLKLCCWWPTRPKRCYCWTPTGKKKPLWNVNSAVRGPASQLFWTGFPADPNGKSTISDLNPILFAVKRKKNRNQSNFHTKINAVTQIAETYPYRLIKNQWKWLSSFVFL